MINIGNALKEQRITNGYSQSTLAKATEIKQQNISRWESNIHLPDIMECVKLADFYGISLDELIGRDYHGSNYSKYNIGTLNNNGGNVDMK